MSNGVQVNVEGFEKLKGQIQRLANDKSKKQEVLLLLRQIAKPTLQAAKTLAPIAKKPHYARKVLVQPGNLKKSLGYITGRKGDAAENPTIYVGPRVKGSQKGWYGHFVHDGVNTYNKGYKRKHVRGANNKAAKARSEANPYLKNAYNQTNGVTTADADKRMTKFIQRRIDKIS